MVLLLRSVEGTTLGDKLGHPYTQATHGNVQGFAAKDSVVRLGAAAPTNHLDVDGPFDSDPRVLTSFTVIPHRLRTPCNSNDAG